MESKNGVAMVPVSAFDPDLLAEEFTIGDKTFTMRPLVFKNYRKLAAAVDASMKAFSDLDTKVTPMSRIMDMVFERDVTVLRLMFPADAETLSDSFIEESMSAPQMRFIIERGILMNNLGDVYPFLVVSKKIEVAPSATAGA